MESSKNGHCFSRCMLDSLIQLHYRNDWEHVITLVGLRVFREC